MIGSVRATADQPGIIAKPFVRLSAGGTTPQRVSKRRPRQRALRRFLPRRDGHPGLGAPNNDVKHDKEPNRDAYGFPGLSNSRTRLSMTTSVSVMRLSANWIAVGATRVEHASEPFQARHISQRSALLEASGMQGRSRPHPLPVTSAEQLFWGGQVKLGHGRSWIGHPQVRNGSVAVLHAAQQGLLSGNQPMSGRAQLGSAQDPNSAPV